MAYHKNSIIRVILSLCILISVSALSETTSFRNHNETFILRPTLIEHIHVNNKITRIFKFGNETEHGKRFYHTKITEIVKSDQLVDINRGWPYSEGTASTVAYARIEIESDTENAEANFYRLQDTNGMDEHTFWRYHLKASKTKKFQYEIEVFEE